MISYIKINKKLEKEYIEKGYWTKKTLLDYWEETLKKHARRTYLVSDRGDRFTYEEVDILSSRLAAYFRELGIKPGEIISFQIPLWSEFVIVAVASLKVGAILHPFAMFYEKCDVIRAMNNTKSRIYIGTSFFNKRDYEEQIGEAKKEIESLEHIILLDKLREIRGDHESFNEILKACEPIAKKDLAAIKTEVSGMDVCLILSTSGTTGGSKGVLFTHNNILFSELGFTRDYHLSEKDAMFMASPLNHATGFHHGVIANMLIGAKLVLQEKFNARRALDLMESEGCTYSMGATPFIYDLVKVLKEDESLRLTTMKLYLCGGAPVPEYLVKDAYRYGIKVCEVYGSTESVPHIYVREEEVFEIMGSSSGRPMDGVEVRVVDENRKEVGVGEIGEEISRGPNVCVGYLNDKEYTDRFIDDEGFFYSGDLCIKDKNGNIKIIGRKKDMIVRGGENLDSNEINNYLEGFSHLRDHAVIGMPDERLGERICAYVVADRRFALEELKEYLHKKGVPKRFCPERVEFVEAIPRTHSGKVKKFMLDQDIRTKLKREKMQ